MNNPIGWCDCTINPVVGCTKCSPGCEHCYAERFAARLAKNPATAKKYAGVVDERGRWTGEISALDMSCFDKLPKRGGRRIFVGSMTDFFHENADFDSQGKVLAKIAKMPQHTFLLLTKRPENARRRYHTQLPNVWLGATICNQEEADAKIPVLLRTPAAKRFISVEPMLGPIDLEAVSFEHSEGFFGSALRWHHLPRCKREYLKDGEVYPSIDWVICGGENGPGARPMHADWVRSLRDQCVDAGVPFYFKGYVRNGKNAEPLLDGREWWEFPSQEEE